MCSLKLISLLSSYLIPEQSWKKWFCRTQLFSDSLPNLSCFTQMVTRITNFYLILLKVKKNYQIYQVLQNVYQIWQNFYQFCEYVVSSQLKNPCNLRIFSAKSVSPKSQDWQKNCFFPALSQNRTFLSTKVTFKHFYIFQNEPVLLFFHKT